MPQMEMQSLRLLGELPAEENAAAYEPSPPQRVGGEAERPPGPPHDWTATMNDHDWEEEQAPGSALEAFTVQCQEQAALHGAAPECSDLLEQESNPGELLRKLSALHLAEQEEPSIQEQRCSEGRRMTPSMRNHVDAKLHFPDSRYPEPLSTEESPRRRARSLPWNSIPEADIEEDDDSLMCCCKLKKKVQFADSLGLCLASIKHFLPSDEPLVPQAVLARLQSYPPTVAVPRHELNLLEERCISECPLSAELLARLDELRVCLEQVSASPWGVNGYVLVKDPGENDQVKIRYTFNQWLSFLDCPASAAQQSPAVCSAPGTRRFHFSLCYPPSTSLIHFAICFSTGHGQEIWDNNQGANYTVSCQRNMLPEVQPSSLEQEESEGPRLW
ncbi:protein phosphatase 1 regulatory subunit 3G [Rhinoderma darwinii]|uniref:protein phosphatase 1 regulatory subunit 3G n=1 Tax=Rhinoderma darwinii TaxID=43563 RepID=UPI003F661A23